MKNVLLSLVALMSIAGASNAQVVAGTTATVKTDPATSVVLNKGYYGVSYNRDTEKTSGVALWNVDAVKARVLGVEVKPLAGVNFGRTTRDLGVTAGVGVKVFNVMGTDAVLYGGWVVPVEGGVVEPKPRVGVVFSRR